MDSRTHRGLAVVWIMVIIVVILALGAGGWLMMKKSIDSALVGNWQSVCLVPDPGSKWAEQHFFTFKSDGTATHIRKSYFTPDCTTLQPELVITESYKVAIPSTGKINLTWTSYDNAQAASIGQGASTYVGNTLRDIYKVSGNTLEFGHGFRNNNAYDGKAGMSEADRIGTLNTYIVYTKK